MRARNSYSLPFFASLALILLLGCEQQPSQKPGADTGNPQGTQDTAATKELEQQPATQTPVALKSLQTGDYSLQLGYGDMSLVSAWSSRIAILEDMARQIGFELIYSAVSDDQVLVNQSQGKLAEILQAVLAGVEYQVEYNAHVDANGFRIARLYVGSLPGKRPSADGETEIQASEDPEITFPQTDAQIFLGDDPEEVDLASRLEFGTVETQTAAVAELDIDPVGLNAAYQLYNRTHSPRVRIAVLELIEAEDNFLARSMIARSLQSTDPDEALYALAIVESLDDFSLAPRVQSLAAHHDAEVRQRAREVLQSITSDFATDDETGPTVILNLPGPSEIREDKGSPR
jgi:hypothetical protein